MLVPGVRQIAAPSCCGFFWPTSLTILQRGDSLAVLAVLAVPDVIGGFYSELVGSKRL